jgi:NAD(P)-dependent dehydrogenase (short-subunit alcohol dehydrogenase family)
MTTLQGKTALVTGASRGIGRATASVLANSGAHVLVHYGRSAQDAESLVAGILSKGGPTWELRKGQRCWRREFVRSSASDWMCSCSTPESARRHASRIIRENHLTAPTRARQRSARCSQARSPPASMRAYFGNHGNKRVRFGHGDTI